MDKEITGAEEIPESAAEETVAEETSSEESVEEESAPEEPERGLKRALRKLFKPVKDTLDGVQSDYSDSSCMKKTFVSMLKLRKWILIPLAVIVCGCAIFFAVTARNTSSTEISLNYEEAANGLNPNSTRFNAYNISSAEVVEGMLRYCGIDPETVDVNALCNAVTITSAGKKNVSEGESFITTTYKVTLKKPRFIKGVSADDLLAFLCKSYKDEFYSRYTENRSILEFDIEFFNDREYLEIADLLDLKAQLLSKYLSTRVKQSKAFIDADSDETFKSLMQKVEDVREYDIAKYRIFVIAAGCSADKARYLTALDYVNTLKEISYKKDIAAYNVHNDGIKMFDDAMVNVVMIPSVDESKKTYYMSKTKTGMDFLATKAYGYLESAEETAKEITVNRDIMAKMSAGTNEEVNLLKADRMIEEIRNKLSDLSERIETVDKTFIRYKTKDYLTFKTVNPSFVQSLRVGTLLAISFVMLLLVYAAIWLRFRYRRGGERA